VGVARKWFVGKMKKNHLKWCHWPCQNLQLTRHGGDVLDRDMGKLKDFGTFLGVSFEGFEEDSLAYSRILKIDEHNMPVREVMKRS
jgi:hypothetical protein